MLLNTLPGQFYMFTVLRFGLAMVLCGHRTLRLLIKRWRGMDQKANVYIDDGICSAKSQLEPMQCSHWLGFLIDLGKGTFQVPQDCIQSFMGTFISRFQWES